MQCHICQRPSSTRLPFNCSSCARTVLYAPRVEHAQLLLDTESIGHEVERAVGGAQNLHNLSHDTTSSTAPHPTFAIERATAERVAIAERTEKIVAQAEILRNRIEETKDYMAKQRDKKLKRISDLEAARKLLSQRQSSDYDPVLKSIKRARIQWDGLHAKTAESRTLLCKEAAQLYGLQQQKRRKGVRGKDLYLIGGLPIPDLKDLNSASPPEVSAAITSLAHLVHLTSHYLSLRLPAEITLAHRDYPLPTIFSPGSSYNARETPYPGFTPTHSLNNSPSASKIVEAGSLPRPRPLHFEKKLPLLAKEDPIVYASFVEGITLLAWDIAWMCKTQGLDVGKSSWEDVCAMGRNLWQLLLAPAQARRQPLPVSNDSTSAITSPDNIEDKRPQVMLGQFSHGTAHSFLSSAEGLEYMSGWRLQTPLKVIDRVKAMLQSERDGAEWQLLEENEWDEGEAQNDGTRDDEGRASKITDVPATKEVKSPVLDVESDGAARFDQGEEGEEKTRGTSGWTKLKSRGS